VLLAAAVKASFGVNVGDVGSVTTFFSATSAAWAIGAGNMSLYNDSYPMKLISLFVRPMFFDAGNVFGIVASIENLLLVSIVLYCFVHYRQIVELYKKVFFIRFAAIVTVNLVLLLAIANYNIGLGLRQRTMFLPPLLSIFVALWAFRQRLKNDGLLHASSAPHSRLAASAPAPALDVGPQV